MKRIKYIIIILMLSNCNNHDKVENRKQQIQFGKRINKTTHRDTIYKTNLNDLIYAKGQIKDSLKTGWWSYFNEYDVLQSKKEYIIIDGVSLENQTIIYDKRGNINKELSYYFTIEIPDTIAIGKVKGYLNYYSKRNFETKYLYVVIENEYSENNIRKDTFTSGNYKRSIFGVYSNKIGKHLINGYLIDNYLKINNKDSTMTIYNIPKYFQKQVYVIGNSTDGNGTN